MMRDYYTVHSAFLASRLLYLLFPTVDLDIHKAFWYRIYMQIFSSVIQKGTDLWFYRRLNGVFIADRAALLVFFYKDTIC